MPNEFKDAPYKMADKSEAPKEKTSMSVELTGPAATRPAQKSWPPKIADENTYDKIVVAPREAKQKKWSSTT